MELTQNPQASSQTISKKKAMWIAIAGAIVLAVITSLVVWNMSQKTSAESSGANVVISQDNITPSTVKIKAGQTVTVANQDKEPHSLTTDTEKVPGFETADPISAGNTYTYTFEDPGTYRFYDPEEPLKYNGTVIVE